MDPEVLTRYLPLYGQAALVTLQISLLGTVLALAVGLAGALLRSWWPPMWRWPATPR